MKIVLYIVYITGILALLASGLFTSFLVNVKYITSGIAENITGQVGPEAVAILIMALMAFAIAIYSIFRD